MGFVNQGVEFGLRQLRSVHGVCERKHSARGARLDDGRAVFVSEANRAPRFVGSVDDADFGTGFFSNSAFAPSGVVTVSAGCADGMHGHEHARTWNDAAIDRLAQSSVQILRGPDI